MGTNRAAGFVSAIPVMMPFILILVMFFFISFQFITRFVSLYFLAVIQPLAAIFTVTDKTKGINQNFWKTWFTFLIIQPAFVLGYAMVQNVLMDMLSRGASFTGVVIFLASLIFLSSVGILVSRIFGDAWTAISANIASATGVSLLG